MTRFSGRIPLDRVVEIVMAHRGTDALPYSLGAAFRKIKRIEGRRGAERGRRNEQRVYIAFESPAVRYGFPPWFRYLRACTTDEDRSGSDAIIETDDIGKILVQIKSSEYAARKFHRRRGRTQIIVIVVKDGMSDEDIRQIVLAEATRKHLELLAVRVSEDETTAVAL